MSQTNDCILSTTGGPTVNDGLALYFGKTADESLNDAEYRWLGEQGATGNTLQDRWYSFLLSLGHTGHIDDMLNEFWCGGGFVPPPTGVELHQDPGFDNPGAWSTGTSVSVSGSEAHWTSASNSRFLRDNLISVTAGTPLRVSFDITLYTEGGIQLSDFSGLGGTVFSGIGSYTEDWTPGTTGWVQLRSSGGVNTFSIDNFSILDLS